eukprot:8910-Heterococcus_DN1.PRE.1
MSSGHHCLAAIATHADMSVSGWHKVSKSEAFSSVTHGGNLMQVLYFKQCRLSVLLQPPFTTRQSGHSVYCSC